MPQGSSAVRPTNGLYLYLYIYMSGAVQSSTTLIFRTHSEDGGSYVLPKVSSSVYSQNTNVVRHSESFIFSVHSGMEATCYPETIILTSVQTMETTDWYLPVIKCIFITQKTII